MFYLPKLNYIEIREYSLYSCPLKIDFSKKLCVVYGTNGTGKSTLLQAILFAIVGPYKQGLKTTTRNLDRKDSRPVYAKDFFMNRVVNVDSNNVPEIEVSFSLANNHDVRVVHSLKDCKLLSAYIDGDEIGGRIEEYQKYEKQYSLYLGNKNKINKLMDYKIWKYQDKIAELSRLPGGFNTLISMFTDVMFFDESRQYTFWRESTQDVIIGKYILDAKSYEDYLEAKRKTKAAESIYKKKSETANFMKKFFENERKNTSFSSPSINNRIEILNLSEEIDSLNNDLDRITDEFISINKNVLSTYNNLKELEEELRKLDITWYSNFLNPSYKKFYDENYPLMLKEVCPACGKKHYFNLLDSGNCIFCGEKLDTEQAIDVLEVDKVKKKLKSEIIEKRKTYEENIKELDSLEMESKEIKGKIQGLEEKKRLLELQTRIEKDPILNHDEERIQRAQNEREIARKEYSKYQSIEREKSKFLEEEFAERFEEFKNTFLKYAYAFYGRDHDVDISLPFREEESLENAMLCFKLDGKERSGAEMLSESQRIFTDLTFRFSVLSCYHDYSFFIFETPDSTLDVFHEYSAKKTLETYIDGNNNLIVSVNARKSTLVSDMVNDLGIENVNVIDLTKISCLANVDNKMTFEDYIKMENI